MALITFQAAIERCANVGKSVLLGNGFSMAYDRGIFDYTSLFTQTGIEENFPEIYNVFEAMGVKDFEWVMRALKSASTLGDVYGCADDTIQRMQISIAQLKELLITAITNSHPSAVDDINNNKYIATRDFLSHFIKIFTTNYDLLLYWALSRNVDGRKLPGWSDGFKGSQDVFTWRKGNPQNSYYLHGAMHLFMDKPDVRKRVYTEIGNPLREQIRTSILNDEFPIFISEGESSDKLIRIEENKYLNHCLDTLKSINGPLFIHGHSLDDNDDHIWKAIANNQGINMLMIGLHGDENSESNRRKKTKAASISARYGAHAAYYDTDTAGIWEEAASKEGK